MGKYYIGEDFINLYIPYGNYVTSSTDNLLQVQIQDEDDLLLLNTSNGNVHIFNENLEHLTLYNILKTYPNYKLDDLFFYDNQYYLLLNAIESTETNTSKVLVGYFGHEGFNLQDTIILPVVEGHPTRSFGIFNGGGDDFEIDEPSMFLDSQLYSLVSHKNLKKEFDSFLSEDAGVENYPLIDTNPQLYKSGQIFYTDIGEKIDIYINADNYEINIQKTDKTLLNPGLFYIYNDDIISLQISQEDEYDTYLFGKVDKNSNKISLLSHDSILKNDFLGIIIYDYKFYYLVQTNDGDVKAIYLKIN